MKDDLISRRAAIDALFSLRYTPGEWAVKGLSMCVDVLRNMPSAQPEPCEDCVSRKSVIRLLHSGYHSRSMIEEVKELPSVQPEPEIYWGYTPTYERPLADDEIMPRLRDINAQLGGSYAIHRAIEIIEAVAERRTDG